ncbi:MAG: N-acetylgalactosamine 6-sulfate sulfatase [Blastopirellula sp.]|nr:MAG: N-acetylgalactosamine 6-sulfate sulfatase [Blastopirellula sp.]
MINAIGKALTLLFTVTLISQFPCTALAQAKDTNPPNIILMMADDLGWGDTGFNGNKIIQTPHLDTMAQAGLKFNRFYSAAPVCSPTRGSCITGRHPFRYGIYFANTGHMKAPEITLAELLKKKGYRTGHFGKWHLGTLTTEVKDANRGKPGDDKHFSPPWKNGFDVCFSTESKVPTWDPLLCPKNEKGKHWWNAVDNQADAIPYGTHYWNEKGESITENTRGDDSRVIMDRAIPFIEQCALDKKSFFTIIWFHAPHLPVVAGPKYVKMYQEHDSFSQHYFGCITALDEQVGRLRQALKDTGVADNTLLCFCSDNGPEGSDKAPGTAANFRGRKRSLYEGGVRVPALIEWPAKIKAGSVTEFPAVTSDYLPTILEIVGASLTANRPIDGVSLVPVFSGKKYERQTPIGFQTGNMSALSDNRYKLYRAGGQKNAKAVKEKQAKPVTLELYDLLADPGETNNIAGKHPEIVASMLKQLIAWQESCAESDAEKDY